uniref:Uncharacterized protein n=1 Tax=Rhizophora mucronata TaxID=61149 RepID=A0A2P2PIZ1_RHIMU
MATQLQISNQKRSFASVNETPHPQ